ncbi:hypothetical protein E2C01_025182 [Portunus trituberculatus]|uniref:Uncharacterized protein n=1 Tax=Portunus trituberculatus TaxID=210409 RepID=A0A5B7ECP1_PORTR|nr:hypothetical protein [Portunus trituberculatus]
MTVVHLTITGKPFLFAIFGGSFLSLTKLWFPAVTAVAMAEGTQTRRNGRPYSSGEKAIALRVLDFFRNEVFTTKMETELEIIRSFKGYGSVCKISGTLQERNERGWPALTAKEEKNRGSPVLDSVDSFDEACIRRIILAFYEKGEIPTLKNILTKVKEAPVNFEGSLTSLYKVIKRMGFS